MTDYPTDNDLQVQVVDPVTTREDELHEILLKVREIHTMIGNVHQAALPAMESISKGGIMGLLAGMRK